MGVAYNSKQLNEVEGYCICRKLFVNFGLLCDVGQVLIVPKLDSNVKKDLLQKLEAKEVVEELNAFLFDILVAVLLHVEFVQRVVGLVTYYASVQVPLQHLSTHDCAANNKNQSLHKVF